MPELIRSVKDMGSSDRQMLEQLLGQRLRENQQLVIRIVTLDAERQPRDEMPRQAATVTPPLPEWCNVYEGLSDDEIADLERTVLTRADLSRPSE